MPVTAGPCLPPELIGHLSELSRRLGKLDRPVHAWLAGGFAVHFLTQHRMSRDVDIKWSHRFHIPPDMRVFEIGAVDGAPPDVILMDGNFTDVFGSFPPDWEKRSQEVHRFDNIVLHVIDPVDLAVSKVERFSERDRSDIRALAEHGLIDPDVFVRRADEALSQYVGDLTFVRHNLADAMEMVTVAKNLPVEPGESRAIKPNESDKRGNNSVIANPFAIPDQPRPPWEK